MARGAVARRWARNRTAALDKGGLVEALGHLPDAIVIVDDCCRLLWANPAAERFFGINVAESVGRSGLELIHPDDLELALLSLGSVQGKQVGTPIEVRLRTPGGWRLAEVVGAPVRTDGPSRIVLSIRDLTDRRRWEVAGDADARFRSLVHNAAAVTILVTPEGVLESASAALTRALGHDPEDVEARPFLELVEVHDRGAVHAAMQAASRRESTGVGPQVVVEVRMVSKSSAGPIPFALAIVSLLEDPTVGGYVVSAHDVTDRQRTERDLRHTLSLLQATLDSTADGILVVDRDGKITSLNRRFADMWRIPDAILEARDDGAAIAFVLGQLRDPAGFVAKVEELYAHPEAESYDTLEFIDGRIFERYSCAQHVGEEVVGRVWSFRDVTSSKRLEDELASQAFHDHLTGLANQALFRDRVEHALARRRNSRCSLAVLFVDLDNFKNVNDSLGHPAGDELITEAARRLLDCARAGDTVARLGGDEFAVLLEDLTAADTIDVATRMLVALGQPAQIAGREVIASASIGIAFHENGATVDQLLRNADLAMYTAKERGKGRFELFEAGMHEAALARLELDTDLRRAIVREEIVVHYQPVVAIDTRTVVAVETLLRWHHPTRGLLEPVAFVPHAEETGLIEELGDIALVQACGDASHWPAVSGDPPAVTVNLAPRQLLDPGLVDRVADVLEQTGLPANRLVLEITERAMMRDPDAAVCAARELKRLGVRLALDDFGVGHSSLSYLERFPVDIIKIDRAFVAGIEHGGRRALLAEAIVALARTLDLVAVAEGVENEAQANCLMRIGCLYAQGYYYSVPKPASDLVWKLSPVAVLAS